VIGRGIQGIGKVPAMLLYSCDEFISPGGVPHLRVPEGVVGIEVSCDDVALG
jgi:hypothetical protein